MSVDDRNPLRNWAIQIKREIQTQVKEVTPQILFEAMVKRDRTVHGYYFHAAIPKSPEDRYLLDSRLETLKFIANSLVVN